MLEVSKGAYHRIHVEGGSPKKIIHRLLVSASCKPYVVVCVSICLYAYICMVLPQRGTQMFPVKTGCFMFYLMVILLKSAGKGFHFCTFDLIMVYCAQLKTILDFN